jgi:alkyldihydroxyacetonephosphate synthase
MTEPIELAVAPGGSVAIRWPGMVDVPADVVESLRDIAPVTSALDDDLGVAECSRDWWPLAMHWSLGGAVPARAAVVCRPSDPAHVSRIAALCNARRIPLTAAGGRSGVSAASVPAFGGVVVDVTGLNGLVAVDQQSGVVEVRAGTFGPELEAALAPYGLSIGHFPQSFDIATVGGWVACRGAGQYSTRYGKIEDLVVGLEVVLADGRIVRTGGGPAAAVGPDLNQVFVGSEGTLGIITTVWLRAHPTPPAERRAAYSFATFADGIEACRRILRAGATPAVLRLYDSIESAGAGRGGDGTRCTMLVLDEGDQRIVDATMAVVASSCEQGTIGDQALVAHWLEHRNDTSALQGLTRKGYVVDTMEIAAPWARLPLLFERVRAALLEVRHAAVATCHLSHSYADGACLYFTFLAKPPAAEIDGTYVAMWDAGQRAVLAGGGNLSHHHGVGLNRSRFVADALGAGFDVLASIKRALDPNGILNPGKLGLPSPFGPPPWP